MKIELKGYAQTFFSLILILIISFFLASFLFASTFWIHEYGHLFFGEVVSIYQYGRISMWQFQYINFPFPPDFLSVFNIIIPVGTGMSPAPSVFWLGITGILTVSLFYSFIGYKLFQKAEGTEKPLIGISTIMLLVYEIVSNLLCGTDNFSHQFYPVPAFICDNFVGVSQFIVFFLFFITSFLLFYHKLIKPMS